MIPNYSVRVLPEGGVAYEGMSREAFACFFRCEMAWWHFRLARKIADFGRMVKAELHARHAGDELTPLLQADGWNETQIATLLRRHRSDR
ncbi:hypothetical protein ACFQY5_36005 [Paeniroseomonas aquatica]|uniref:Uncharacterized protein n=1 Tax=Paeniroseomonas aquatica TaxID=373043 RepID=A0ABT8AFX5_9PROT|nr:hypothetical protein [Paeniroseomonas aquatica]MDN3568719.1 hypothetical protein [Paeniroseomonas aquatica]